MTATVRKANLGVSSDGQGFGQNLYYGGGDGYDTAGDAIDWWYNSELGNYDTYGSAAVIDIEAGIYSPPPAQPGEVYGHFTQTVWVVRMLPRSAGLVSTDM
jgi:hypothetical protein